MGFWKQLFGLEELCKELPKPTRPAPPIPTIKEPKKDPSGNISEPVLSIIQTLKDGEWSFEGSGSYGLVGLYFTHEWFGNMLTIYHHLNGWSDEKPKCQSEWMTQAEKEAVGSVCWQIYQGRVKWEKEQSLAKQRESFMCLVKEIND